MSSIRKVHPGYSNSTYGLGTPENMVSFTKIYTRNNFMQEAIWNKLSNPMPAQKCGDMIYLKNRYRRTGGFSEGVINKDWDKPRTLNPTGGKPIPLGRHYRDQIIIKDCHMDMMKRDLMEDLDLTTREIQLIASKRMIEQGFNATPMYNQGWKAGARYQNLSLGSWESPIVLTPDNVKQFFAQLKQVFHQQNIDIMSMGSSDMFALVESPLLMMLEEADAVNDYWKNGDFRPDQATQDGCKSLEAFKCWDLCVYDSEKPSFAADGVPKFRILFGLKSAFHSIWSFDMESDAPNGSLKKDKFEFCMEWNIDTYPVFPEFLGTAVVAVPGFNFGQAAAPATLGG